MLKCELCGREVDQLNHISTGDKVCQSCDNKIQDTEVSDEISLTLPRDVIWVGKIAKMGVSLIVVIPKTQRAFLQRHKNYIFIIKEVEV